MSSILLSFTINTVREFEWSEFDNLQVWAQTNKLVINMLKTKEIVFHRLNPRGSVMPPPLTNIDRIKFAKLLGFILWITLVRVKKLTICENMYPAVKPS